MFIPRIYSPQAIELGSTLILTEERTHYIMKVLRLGEGDLIILFNGQGGEYVGRCHVFKKDLSVEIVEYKDIQNHSPLAIHLGQGLSRGDRMDWAIQKATELGVESITPLQTEFCQVKLDEDRSQKRLQHWQNIAISACEQSGRTTVPTIHPPMALHHWMKQTFEGDSIILAPEASQPLNNMSSPKAIRLAIGPESGWSEKELTQFNLNGFVSYHLGPRILRTETAPLVAISILQGLFGDLGDHKSA